MGDGRYYTDNQFYNVVLYLILIIFLLIGLMNIIFRNKRNNNSVYILLGLSLLLGVCICSFLEIIVTEVNVAHTLRVFKNLLLSYVYLSFFSCILLNILPIYANSKTTHYKSKVNYFNIVTACSGIIIFLVETIVNKSIIIKSYTFFSYELSLFSIIVFILIAISLLAICVYLVFRIMKEKKSVTYGGILIVLILSIMSFLPLCCFLFAYFLKSNFLYGFEFILVSFLGLSKYILATSFLPNNITPFAFDMIKEVILDYVFITEESGKIVYKNLNVTECDFFKKINKIDVEKIEDVFNAKVYNIEKHSIPCFKYYNDLSFDDMFFTFKTFKIDQNKTHMFVITLADVTKLMELLDLQEIQNKKLDETNKKLIEYSHSVYMLEKQKEINSLMEQITHNQLSEMKKIEKEIELAQNSSDLKNFNIEIDKIIMTVKNSLKNVRHAVVQYKEYYGGKE